MPEADGLPPLHSKVLVSYWALDCLLDWVFAHDNWDDPWDVQSHYDQLRGDMEETPDTSTHVLVRKDDLDEMVNGNMSRCELGDAGEQARDRLRAALEDQP